MDSKGIGSNFGQVVGDLKSTKPATLRPKLSIPARNAADILVKPPDNTLSPMTFVSRFFPDSESFSQLLAGAMISPSPKFGETLNDYFSITSIPQSGNSAHPPPLVENDAANKDKDGHFSCGAGRSSIPLFKTMTPASLPIPQSHYLTIPPGLSPTSLLASPVFLSTGQNGPFVTGVASPPFVYQGVSASISASDMFYDQTSNQDGSSIFAVKPFPTMGKDQLSSVANLGPFGVSHQEALAQVQAQAQAQTQIQVDAPSLPPGNISDVSAGSFDYITATMHIPPLQTRAHLDSTSQALLESSTKTQHLQSLAYPSSMVERPSEDGYNWRKYGQKQVKGSEYPRSYYKCTSVNCLVKKKVERSLDGQVTQIVYKGEHNHPKPQATRRMSSTTSLVFDKSGRERKVEGSATTMKGDSIDQVHMVSTKAEMLFRSSDPSSGINSTPEPSSLSISDDGSKFEDGDKDEPDSKRRKENAGDSVPIVPLQTIREPRVVVQTISEVDILDDGYRWRKYGQKVVKGNPYPRSYYKCTNLGCLVRKHVERSSSDPKAVIFTYEGKHDHEVPTARNSNSNFSNFNHDNNRAAVTATPLATHVGFCGSTIAKPSVTLQEQFTFGKLLEDKLKVGERMAMNLDMTSERGRVNQQSMTSMAQLM